MDCPYCANDSSKVTDKRKSPGGIRRRRECLKCEKRFTTYEVIEKSEFFIIKKDGRRERFDKQKLEKGIETAFEKRPVPKERIDKMINEVEDNLRKMAAGKKEVRSSTIGDLVMKKIERLDKVAYVRFASVYKDFHDIGDFKRELKEMER